MKHIKELVVKRVSEDDRYISSDEVKVEAGSYADEATLTFYAHSTSGIHPYDIIKVTIEYDND